MGELAKKSNISFYLIGLSLIKFVNSISIKPVYAVALVILISKIINVLGKVILFLQEFVVLQKLF